MTDGTAVAESGKNETTFRGDAKGSMRSLERALDILDVISGARGPLRLTDIARATGLHPTTALRSLQVLAKRGYVSTGPDGYWPGSANLVGANTFVSVDPLTTASARILAELAEAVKLTASCQVRHNDVRVVTHRVEGLHPLRYSLPIGDPQPLYLGAGRILIAWLSKAEIDALIERIEPMTKGDGQPVSADELRQGLAEIRRDGYHVSMNDRVVGASGVSVPVWGGHGNVMGALVLSGPSERYDEAHLAELVPELSRAANALSRRFSQ